MKKYHLTNKLTIISIFLTLLFVIIAFPLYLDANGIKGVIQSRHVNKVACIYILNNGNEHNTIEILPETIYNKSAGCPKNDKQLVSISEIISSIWKEYIVKFKVIGDGKITIKLTAPDKKHPIIVDYRNFTIDNHNIFNKKFSLQYHKPYIYHTEAKDGDIIKFSFQARKHFFRYRDLRKVCNFSWLMFLNVLIISFFMAYKLVHYIAKFKIIENNSRIDIVFLVVFTLLMFFPMSHISNSPKSLQENRMLAKYPQFLINGNINNKFGEQFNSWFNDRFNGRKGIIKIHSGLIYKLNSIYQNGKHIKAKNDMIFYKNNLRILSKEISEHDQEEIANNLLKLRSWCSKNNIKLYVMIPPTKEDIYKYELSNYYHLTDKNTSVLYSLQKYLKDRYNLPIIYPREIYTKEYDDFTHFKTDHHWTEFGAYLGYKELIKSMQKDFPDIKLISEDEFNIFYNNKPRLGSFKNIFDRPFYRGSNCAGLNLTDNCPLSYKYKYFDHKDLRNLKINIGPLKMSRITYYDKGINKNVTLLGNSYGGFLMEFLPYNFKNVQMLRVNNEEENVKNIYSMKRFEKHILDFKTDILIIYQQSEAVYDFEKLYDK